MGIPQESLVRPRLTDALDQAVRRPLTVVRAPAGHGKTTALAHWRARSRHRGTWITVDERDDDAAHLVAHVLGGLAVDFPDIAAQAQQALARGEDPVREVLPRAAEAVCAAGPGPFVVVLDGLHRLGEAVALRMICQALDVLPDAVRVVCATRTPPPLHVERRYAAGTVAQIGPADLAFRLHETEALLNRQLGLALGVGTLAGIHRDAGAWAAGIALMGAALRDHPDPARREEALRVGRAHVARYLEEEVLAEQPDEMRTFLRRTSVLDELTAAACAGILHDHRAGQTFAELRRRELFVTVEDDGRLRHHPAFARVLRRELEEREGWLLPELHRRAAVHFERVGDAAAAVRHASAAGDGGRAARLLAAQWPALVASGRTAELQALLAGLPPHEGPHAATVRALDVLCLAAEGADARLVTQRLDALELAADDPRVAPVVDVLHVSPLFGDVTRSARHGRALWRRHAADPPMQTVIAADLGFVLWLAGDGDGARDVLEPLVGVLPAPVRAAVLAVLALVAATDGEHVTAERYARTAVAEDAAAPRAGRAWAPLPDVALGEALRRRGALDEAAEALGRALRLTGYLPGSVRRGLALVVAAEVAAAARDHARGRRHAAAARRILGGYPDVGVLATRLTAVEAALDARGPEELLGTPPTAAEQRVLERLPSDLTLKQIGDELYLSLNTVRTHVRRLYRRLGVGRREDAVAVARERGLL